MGNAYFINTPLYGDLFLEEILFSYDNIPIVFTCTNESNIRCICVCDDIIENQSWIITKVDSKVLLDVLHDKISICKAFELSTDKTTIAEKVDGRIIYILKSYEEIDPMELPDPDEKLEMEDELNSYIAAIEFENFCLSLFVDTKEKESYSFTFNIKSTTTVSTSTKISDTLKCLDEFIRSDNIEIDYSPKEDYNFEPVELSKNALDSDVNLLNAA
ncbi:MAG: hypothetical protein LUH21_03865 [Clostridiales bacterium]|nr:hypothetical protein [Clostridiales bacterium]